MRGESFLGGGKGGGGRKKKNLEGFFGVTSKCGIRAVSSKVHGVNGGETHACLSLTHTRAHTHTHTQFPGMTSSVWGKEVLTFPG